MTTLLSNDDILGLIEPATLIDALETAYRDLASGAAVNRPRSNTYTPLGDGHWYNLKTMDGSLPRRGVHALRLNSDHTYESVRDGVRRREKLPYAAGDRFVGLILLFDIATLEPVAILQDGELQRWLVGCTSALVARHLARPGPATVGLVGSGWQAETQLLALASIRDLRAIRAYSPNAQRLSGFCERVSGKLGREVRPVRSAAKSIEGSDIVVLATNARDPVIHGTDLAEGQHVNAVTSKELDRATLERASMIVVRNRQPSSSFHPPGQAPWDAEDSDDLEPHLEHKVVELGRILHEGRGRASARDITVFPSSVGAASGLGVTFAAVGQAIFAAAKAKGIGRDIPTEWFTETAKP